MCFPVCYLDCSYDSDRLLPALLTLTALRILSLSAACPDLSIATVAYVKPVTVTELCLSDLLLFILIKLHLDLNALTPLITEDFATSDPAALFRLPSPTMDSLDQLLHLHLGGLSIEEYVHQFCELSDKVPFGFVFLKDIFLFGLIEPVKSWLPEGKFDVSLTDFMDYALMVAGSSFTVGVLEEKRNTASETEVADAPERTHKRAATATGHIITAIHESGKVTASHAQSSHR